MNLYKSSEVNFTSILRAEMKPLRSGSISALRFTSPRICINIRSRLISESESRFPRISLRTWGPSFGTDSILESVGTEKPVRFARESKVLLHFLPGFFEYSAPSYVRARGRLDPGFLSAGERKSTGYSRPEPGTPFRTAASKEGASACSNSRLRNCRGRPTVLACSGFWSSCFETPSEKNVLCARHRKGTGGSVASDF